MTKQFLRKTYLQKRMLLDKAEQQEKIMKMVEQLTNIPTPPLNFVMSYFALTARNEIVATPFETVIHHLHPHCRFCYPKINAANSSMEAMEVAEGKITVQNIWGITEPEGDVVVNPQQIDILFVPLLAFDKRGFRVGYGKGFYDRFMARCRPDAVTIGFSFFEPVDRIEDTDEYDVPLTFCITAERLFRF